MKKLGLLAATTALATAVVAAPTATANSCTFAGLGTITIGSGDAPTLYIDDRGIQYGTWIYLESNGESNLQRGGTTLAGAGETDTCNDSDTPDTAVF